jgi:hypothetical protein
MRTDAQLLAAAQTDAHAFRDWRTLRRRPDEARQPRLRVTHVRRRAWQCYIGRAAVDQKIVSADFLGE